MCVAKYEMVFRYSGLTNKINGKSVIFHLEYRFLFANYMCGHKSAPHKNPPNNDLGSRKQFRIEKQYLQAASVLNKIYQF
jgi:hypothetical protein